MRVFVTGASGWIGSAVVPELVKAGHEVTGLARSEASAEVVAAAGARVLRGTMDDLDVLRDAAAASDGVIHLAFKHDIAFTGNFREAAGSERRAVEAFAGALAGSGRPLVVASGLGGLTPGRVVTEQDGHEGGPAPTDVEGPAARLATAELVLSLASQGIRSSIVRLCPTVHGEGDKGFMARLAGIAREKGVAGYLGDGANRWPAVHRLDAANLFRLALEKAPAGTTLHAVGDEGVPIRSLAEVMGEQLGVPVKAIEADDAAGHFGWLAGLLGLDIPASAAATRELLGWQPVRPGLLADLGEGHYFRR
ncbi:SDR family oxidoreductase [Amycolatopsis acidicola]|uniref:SDR family oxidoreductase n=1 Tax=Amycolatopsis acidicola TaxID=2596893 RepID=A0A5N0UW42_9PSEU|nr:SDR family oxidoreductase [Amycolatopsis acidicola]KAA9156181.1 SDR family oxidoreductase [Amycolatopsis acidicola]